MTGTTPAAIDPERLDPAERRVEPFAEDDAGESDLAALAGTDANDDLVESLSLALFDIDIAAECCSDGSREVVARELLGALVEREVPFRNVDGLVRHVSIVSPFRRGSHT